MEKKELEIYETLSKFQKELVTTLISIGFKHVYFATYGLDNWGTINVDKYNSWADVLKLVYKLGKDEKCFEFLNVLGIWKKQPF